MLGLWRLAAVTVLAAGLAVAVPASPASAAACPDPGSGVTVVVDFSGLGGGAAVRCAPGNPATGLAALRGAGFTDAFVPRQPGFVCQIDGLPDPCNGAPTDAYWSYWYADRGGSWRYSSLGAGSRDPGPGTVEGWAFGAGGAPGTNPPAAPPPPEPPPEPEPPPPAGDDPPAGGQGPPAGGRDSPPDPRAETGESPPGAGPAPGTGGTIGPSSAVPTLAPPGTASDPGAGTSVAAPPVAPAAGTATGGGGLAGTAVAAALVATLAGMGFWTARRRRGAPAAGPP